MILKVEADSAYLILPKARSRAAAWLILDNEPTTTPSAMPNAPALVLCYTLRHVMSSAADAETGGLFLAAQKACPLRVTLLAELGHIQPAKGTPLYNDNSTATDILTGSMRQKFSRGFDMRFYWLRDRIEQQQFQLIWRKGKANMADYFTEHHPPYHHKLMRYKYLHKALLIRRSSHGRGCVATAPAAFGDSHIYARRHA